MARLRSAEASVTLPVTPKSALDRIAEASSKLNSNATPATTLEYPSLAKLEYPSLDKAQYPEIPLTTPKASSRIPTYAATTGKKLGNFSEKLKDEVVTTSVKPAQKLKVPSTGFEFRVIKTGEKKVEALVPPVSPAAEAVTTPARPIAKKRSRRFSDVHRRQFEKMESITTHYAAKRTPKQPVTIEKMPRGVKRTKSRAELGDRGPPSSPSPVKLLVEDPRNAEGDSGSPMKRTKISAVAEEKTTLSSRPSGIPRLGMTPMKGFKKRPATVAKISIGGRLNLTPTTRLASLTQAGATPSEVPSALTTPVVDDTDSAPSTVPVLPNRQINLSGTDTPKKETNPLAPPKTDGFTFRSKGAGMNYKRLSDMHSLNYNLNKDTPSAPTPLLTPMKMSAEDPFVGMARRAAIEWTPVATAPAEKRKAPHSDDDADNDADAIDTVQEGGARKRLKFTPVEEPITAKAPETKELTTIAAGTPMKKKKSLLNRGKAILLRSRLNMLAAPKRRVDKDSESSTPGDKMEKDVGRIRWK
ncbi:hypothetical protein L873DRAFT_871464 [Choiromyces venosus 120613-1]|uniref:Uncharacterized protein n=1 Tax=Choiromyces venosus 120613-1 TaxID=1336337 RepID=A0A3N4JN40_9PEZI|nr:hypothetical protein L873DRAFT_871464 [Choiromyces venosus 120613-1]